MIEIIPASSRSLSKVSTGLLVWLVGKFHLRPEWGQSEQLKKELDSRFTFFGFEKGRYES